MQNNNQNQAEKQYQPSYNAQTIVSSDTFNKVHDECNVLIIPIFLAFKFTPIIIYLLLKIATDLYLFTFLIICLLLSADFWFTKNIAGRKLAALRWYSQIDEQNQEKWYFACSQARVPYSINVLVFWVGQFIPMLFWISISLINIVTLSAFWTFLACFSITLLAINFGLFLECKGDHQKRVNGITKRLGIQFYELNEEKN